MDKRTAYVEKLSAQMVEWDNQIDRLKDRAKSGGTDADGGDSQPIADLQRKRDEAAVKLQAVSTAGDHEWEELKAGTDRVWDEIGSSLRDAVMKIK